MAVKFAFIFYQVSIISFILARFFFIENYKYYYAEEFLKPVKLQQGRRCKQDLLFPVLTEFSSIAS